MSRTIFVTGATGIQGGGVVRALLDNIPEIHVNALVRNPDSAASQALAKLGPHIKLFKGDFDDVSSIQEAASDCAAAFLNAIPVFTDLAGEVRHIHNLVAACARVPSLRRIVYTSSSIMDHPTDSRVWTEYVPDNPKSWMTAYLMSKRECEAAITETSTSDFPEGWCIIRGTTFFSNFLPPASKFLYPDLETKQTITTALSPKLLIPYLDPNDLSILAATVLLSNKEQWNKTYKGTSILLSRQQLVLSRVVKSMNKVLKNAGSEKQIKLNYIPEEEAKQRAAAGDVFADAQLFQTTYDDHYDIDRAREFEINIDQLVTVDEYFERKKEQVLAAVGGR